METLFTLVQNVNRCDITEKRMEVPQKMKNRTATRPSISICGYLPQDNENINLKRYVHPMFIKVLFIIAKIWKQPKCPSVEEWVNFFSHRKEWNIAICDNMDGTQRHYAKWNKLDKERQIPYDLS